MAVNFLLKRSGTASKRPTGASMALGELDLNYDASTGGVYYKDSAGNVVKVGPCQVSATAPNVAPAGSAGNSAGEFWFDTVSQTLQLWSGSAWVDATSTADLLPLAGGTMTGDIIFNAGQTFSGTVGAQDFQAKGDLVAGYGANLFGILSVGTNGQILYANSGTATGLCWAAPPSYGEATPDTLGLTYACVNTFSFPGPSLDNASFGYSSMGSQITTGDFNVAVGNNSAFWMSTGCGNVAIGNTALFAQTAGSESYNTGVGYQALSNSGGSGNVAIGYNAGFCVGFNNVGGDNNTILGTEAGCTLESGSQNVLIGCGVQAASATGSCQLAIGYAAGQCWLSGTSTKAIRPGAGIIDCAGSCGTAGQVLMSNGANALCWGAAGGASAATPTVAGIVLGRTVAGSTALGCNSLLSRTGGIGNIAIGDAAMCSSTSAQISIAIGDCALKSVTTINSNIAIGFTSLCSNTSGTGNVGLGNQTLMSNLTGNNNIAIGPGAMRLATGASSIGIGSGALSKNAGNANVSLGGGTGSGVTSGSCNTFLGGDSGANIVTGSCNVFVGTSSGAATDVSCCLSINVDTLTWLTGDNTGAIQPGAGIIDCANSTGSAGQVLMSNGANALCWGTAGGGASAATPTVAGTVLGCTSTTPFSFVVGLGCNAVNCVTTATCVTGIGANALSALTTGSGNTALGVFAASSMATAQNNTAVGHLAMQTTTLGEFNTAVGSNAMQRFTCGCYNTAIGVSALTGTPFGANTGCFNAGSGFRAIACLTSGSFNAGDGAYALNDLSTGSFNSALGGCAGKNITSGCGNVVLGSFTGAGAYAPVFTVSTQSDRLVAGSTAVTNAYVQVAWTVVSDARDKIVQGDVPHGLDFVNQLEPKAFHFKEERDSDVPHGPLRYGFLAQDVLALEGGDGIIIDAEDSDKLRYNGEALVPVLVNAVKELTAMNAALEARIAALEGN